VNPDHRLSIEVSGVHCPLCGDIIYSRTRHDFRYCGCGNCHVDGGIDYLKFGWTPGEENKPTIVELTLDDADVKTLYYDWYREENKYGIIKGKKH